MSDVVLFISGVAKYLRSVHTPLYTGNPDALINPDLSAVQDIPVKYWRLKGGKVAEMTATQKKVIDGTEQAQKDTLNALRDSIKSKTGLTEDELRHLEGI